MRFKPKLSDIINDYKMDSKVLVPKNGGLNDATTEMLAALKENGEAEVLTYRGEDIPQVIEDMYFGNRVKALGITGDDLFDEYCLRNPGSALKVLETLEWYDEKAMFRRPTLCLLAPSGKKLEGKVRIALNKKYEETSKQYLTEIKPEFDYLTTAYAGNTEQTVSAGINDACIEIVYSGKSIEEYGLVILDKVRSSDFVVIGVNEASPKAFARDYAMIESRVKNPKEGSFVNSISGDANKSFKKLGEEFSEYLTACSSGDKENVVAEYADLLCMMNINAARLGVDYSDITIEMWRRMKRD